MRRLRELSRYRDSAQERQLQAMFVGAGLALVGWEERDLGGCFLVPVGAVKLRVLAGVGEGWDHIGRIRCASALMGDAGDA